MNFLATYTMRSRTSAVVVVLVAAILSLLLPPFSYLSGAALGLVTLRHGGRDGLVVMALAASLFVLPALVSGGSGMVAIFAAVVWFPVWLLALLLRQTVSLPLVVVAAMLLGAMSVVAIHLALADPEAWWRGKLELLQPVLSEAGWNEIDIRQGLDVLAGAMTAMLAGAVMVTPLISLFIARWWQAQLYNPGGWRKEFHELRMPAPLMWVAAAVVVVALATSGGMQRLAGDLLLLFMLGYMLQGLGVIHNLVYRRGLHVGWLVALYALLLIIPQIAVLVAVVGIVDSWADFRSRIEPDAS
ncbi:MAG TPA: DUF2232 domain-containing protein [Gammaproteobacteria bacterium]|nr:DUF2232 domain-containing protein [Gammaproteobacteria bacterium]